MKIAQLTKWGRSAGRVSGFYFFLGRKSVRTRLFAALGLIPVALAVAVRIAMVGRPEEIMTFFNDTLMTFFLQFYIVIVALFFGTSICGEEVEGKTLPYISTKPVPRSAIIAGKFGASFLLQSIMVAVGLTLSFGIMNAERVFSAGMPQLFLRSVAALLLGVAAYTALFAFLGTLLKRSIIIGLIFGLGWENVIQYFPGSTQKLSVAHYLKSLLPYHAAGGGKYSFLLYRLEPTSAALSVLTLVLITAVFLAAACLVFSVREYRFDE